MRIISRRTIRRYWQRHPDAEIWLRAWLAKAEDASWNNLQQVRRDYPHADGVKVRSNRILTVFNVAGNKYRLIVVIIYNLQRIYIREFLPHAEYNKGAWKRRN